MWTESEYEIYQEKKRNERLVETIYKTEKESENIEVEDAILIFAMRYAMGRQTFAPTIVIENIKSNINLIPQNTLRGMIKDIEDHPPTGFGMECDYNQWMGFKNYLQSKLSPHKDF